MLKLEKDGTWIVSSSDLRTKGLRAPQGFSFKIGYDSTYFWSTNPVAAYLFYRRHGSDDPNVIEQFQAKVDKEGWLHELSSSVTSDAKFAGPADKQYRPYQVSGIEYGLNVGNFLIADEMRLGKTIVAIGILNNIEWDGKKVLIICPKTAKRGWEQELKDWLIKPHKIQVVDAQTPLDKEANVYIINYDILHIRTELQKIPFSVIIPDECHFIARADTRRAKFFFELSGDKIVALSGTPLLNNPKDLLTIVKWLNPTWDDFHFSRGAYFSQKGITLSDEEFQEMLRSTMMLRRLQAQVFSGDPPMTRVVEIDSPDHLKPHIEIERNGYKQLNQLTDYTNARKLIGIYKVPYVLNHIDTYTSEGDKIVVFAYHKSVIDRIASSLGNKAAVIYGGSSDKDRELAKKRFNEDPKCQVLVGSIGAASMALNLSKAAHIVFAEFDWSNGLVDQASQRCSDKEQKKQVLIEYIVFENSLDLYMLNKIRNKDAVCDKNLDVVYA